MRQKINIENLKSAIGGNRMTLKSRKNKEKREKQRENKEINKRNQKKKENVANRRNPRSDEGRKKKLVSPHVFGFLLLLQKNK